MRSSSDSAFSSPRDPKAIVFPVRVGEESSSRGSFLHEEEDIPPTSRKYDASYKKTLTREMLKCGEDEYKESLRGLSRGHFQPIYNNLVEIYFTSISVIFFQATNLYFSMVPFRTCSTWKLFKNGS